MINIKCFRFLAVLSFLTLSEGDTQVTCVLNESCILPCELHVGSDPLIHWIHMSTREHFVHSFYNNQTQLGHQVQRFRGRTSLFTDQIPRRNASLLLTAVKIQDEGRYMCRTSTSEGNKKAFVDLKIEAPVSDIRIHQDGNRITCSSEGIYPQPELTWSTEPPSNTTLQNRTTVHQTEEKLYNITSSLMDHDPNLTYYCTVKTQTNQKTGLVKPGISNNVGKIPRMVIGVPLAVTIVVVVIILTIKGCTKNNTKTPSNPEVHENSLKSVDCLNELNTDVIEQKNVDTITSTAHLLSPYLSQKSLTYQAMFPRAQQQCPQESYYLKILRC
ncbi:V-set domain-containing T-cell activation inhibitor 1-like [Xiphophorus couchianus]|uniref:V-set domain-containing T-cell activation inhibitor 1-like n=1 Tax=Xiphophorus couchianus TaxID=32473 RepID=UPI0010161D8C|nr:V-set domain-containing T-cell activation inhibitor 1-like [Xiphophorus couchianus]